MANQFDEGLVIKDQQGGMKKVKDSFVKSCEELL